MDWRSAHREAMVIAFEAHEDLAIDTFARIDVFDADGKKVGVATGSAVILPGRPATVTAELTLPDLAGSQDDEERP